MAGQLQGGVRLRRTLLDTKTRDQPEQQRRPQQGRHGAGRDQHRPEPAQGLQQQIGGRQQQGAEDGRPQQPLGQFSDPQQPHHGGRRQPDKTDQPHHAHHAGGDEDREAEAGESQVLERDPQAASAGIVQLQHCQRAHQHRRQHRGQQQPWQQIADAAPAVLGQRSAPPHQQPFELLLEEQQQSHADGGQIEVYHQPCKNDDHGIELTAPSQGEDQPHGQASPGHGDPLPPDQQPGGGEQGHHHQRQLGARGHPQGGGRGQGIAQHLLHQGTGKPEGGTGQQADGKARQPAEMDYRLAGIVQLGGEQGLPPERPRQLTRQLGASQPQCQHQQAETRAQQGRRKRRAH